MFSVKAGNGNYIKLINYLKAEYHEVLLYASKEVVFAAKEFLENPDREKFLTVILSMRKDLWIKKTDLNLEEIYLVEQ